MYDRISINILGLFLLLGACSLVPYLLDKNRSVGSTRWWQISPQAFALSSVFFGGLCFVCLVFLGPENVLLAAGLALGLLLSLLHPVTATCFFVNVLFLRPWEALPYNSFLPVLPRLFAALTTAVWGVYILRKRSVGIVWNLPCFVFGVFLVWLLICSFFSQGGDSVQFYFETFAPIAVLSFLILNSLTTVKDLQLFSRTLVVAVSGILCVALYTTMRDYLSDPQFFRLHSMGIWGNANDLAALAVLAWPLTVTSFLVRQKDRARKLPGLFFAALLLVGILWSQSRGALISLAVGCFGYFAFCRAKKMRPIFIVLILCVPLVMQLMPKRDEGDLAGSTESRANYLIAGLRMAKSHPIFGVGINNYSNLYESYTPAFLEWGNRTAHSSWVLILAEAGPIGLLLFGGLYALVIRSAWKIRKYQPQFFMALISYGVAMSFLSHTYLFLPYVLMAFALAATRIHVQRINAEKLLTEDAAVIPQVIFTPPSAKQKNAFVRNACIFIVASSICSSNLYAEEVISFTASVGAEKPIGAKLPTMSSSITLQGSRGETLLFLLHAIGTGCAPLSSYVREVSSTSTNTSASTGLANGLTLNLNTLPLITTEHPSFPGAYVGAYIDPVVPLSGPTNCFAAKTQDSWLLGELAISERAAPGNYEGAVSYGAKTIAIKIHVWKMVIPSRPAIPAYSEMTTWFNMLGHFGKWDASEPELAQKYVSTMKAHRVFPLKSNIARTEFNGDGPDVTIDLDQKPSKESSFAAAVLSQRPDWSYFDFPTVGASGFEQIDYPAANKYFRAIQNTLAKINRPGKAIVYLWDEPKLEKFPELIRLSKLVKEVAPSLKQLVTTTYFPALHDTMDIFVPVINQFDALGFAQPQAYREIQKSGHEVWWYVSCMSHGCDALVDTKVPDMVIDRPASYVRSIGWLSMKYSLDAFLYYSVNNGYQFFPKRDPWISLWDFSGNGDGTLFYPGRPGEHGVKAHMPIPSLRLKLWRESSYDAEYIKWMNQLKQKPAWFSNEFANLVHSTTVWSRDYSSYQSLRDKMGDYLNAQPDLESERIQ